MNAIHEEFKARGLTVLLVNIREALDTVRRAEGDSKLEETTGPLPRARNGSTGPHGWGVTRQYGPARPPRAGRSCLP